MDSNSPLVDIEDKERSFLEANEILKNLNFGFDALAMDYGFYIENTFGGNHTIFELRDNVKYRLFSSIFHLRLLLQHIYFIEEKVQENYITNRLNHVEPNSLMIILYQREVSSVFDSIVFHLSSIYDYVSLLINYICGKNKQEKVKWTQLTRSARDEKNMLSERGIASIVDTIDKQFVRALYDHRSELIHRESDLNNFKYSISLRSAKTEIHFLCTKKLIKKFKKIVDPDSNYTTSYFSYLLIKNTAETIAKLLYGLKQDIEQNSGAAKTSPKNPHKPFLIVIDPDTKEAKSPSIMYWPSFMEFFKFD